MRPGIQCQRIGILYVKAAGGIFDGILNEIIGAPLNGQEHILGGSCSEVKHTRPVAFAVKTHPGSRGEIIDAGHQSCWKCCISVTASIESHAIIMNTCYKPCAACQCPRPASP